MVLSARLAASAASFQPVNPAMSTGRSSCGRRSMFMYSLMQQAYHAAQTGRERLLRHIYRRPCSLPLLPTTTNAVARRAVCSRDAEPPLLDQPVYWTTLTESDPSSR